MIEMGVREGVWALVAVLVLYLVVILFRLASPRKPADSGEKPGAPNTLLVDASVAAEPEPQPVLPPSPEEEAVSRDLLNELEIQQLRRDVAQLRTESDFLRRELAATRRDVDELRDAQQASQQAAREPVQYTRPVSPQHSEAMLLAGRGIEAARIAEHCGISVAEAELVCALARAEEGR